jgi:hypothetical protein
MIINCPQQAYVVVLYMAHFMGYDALELLAVHYCQQTGGNRDGGVPRAHAGGEGIGGRVVDHKDLGLGEPFSNSQGFDNVMQLTVLLGVSWTGPRYREDQALTRGEREGDPGQGQHRHHHGPHSYVPCHAGAGPRRRPRKFRP